MPIIIHWHFGITTSYTLNIQKWYFMAFISVYDQIRQIEFPSDRLFVCSCLFQDFPLNCLCWQFNPCGIVEFLSAQKINTMDGALHYNVGLPLRYYQDLSGVVKQTSIYWLCFVFSSREIQLLNFINCGPYTFINMKCLL